MTAFQGFLAGLFVCLFVAAAVGIWLIIAGEPPAPGPEPDPPILPDGWRPNEPPSWRIDK